MHEFIAGPTLSGKSFLGQVKAREYLRAGFKVLVCDPLGYDWPCTWHTRDRRKFLEVAKRSFRCVLVVEEAGDRSQGIPRLRDDPEAEWLFTMARHWGHKTIVIGQGGVQLTPLMRDQCATLHLFGSSPKAVEGWIESFNEPGLAQAADLNFPRYHFMMKTRGQPLRGPLKVAA